MVWRRLHKPLATGAVLWAAVAGCAHTDVPAPAPAAEVSSVVTEWSPPEADGLANPAFLGMLAQAQEHYRNGQPDQAMARTDWILARLQSEMDPQARHVCLSNETEAGLFQQSHQPADDWVRVDPTWCNALTFKAFLLVEQHRLDEAFDLLQRAAEDGPLSAHPQNEMGYILNAKKRYRDAFRTYHQALKRARAYPDPAAQAAALRGIGFALSELGDLQAARTAYLESLEIEPNNEVALNELRYLDHELARSPVE